MAHVEAGGAGIGELDEGIELGALVPGHSGVGLGLLPPLLPFFLDGGKIILHVVAPLCVNGYCFTVIRISSFHLISHGLRPCHLTLEGKAYGK
jgi:hypothetical protein